MPAGSVDYFGEAVRSASQKIKIILDVIRDNEDKIERNGTENIQVSEIDLKQIRTHAQEAQAKIAVSSLHCL